jgi:hypothetical protein
MPLYQITQDNMLAVPETSFVSEGVFERKDLQRLLKGNIAPLGDDLMVIVEEFGHWEDSSRRIDLLCVDKQRRLVVVELKRTEDGGHMELQAIRYAAMVSSMTLEQAIAAHARMLGGEDAEGRAKKVLLEFLETDSAEDIELSGDVRIVLVSADFSQELTTSVIWLNKHDLDITCIRLRPYRLGENLLIDVSQIIPLPEATDYEVKIRAQAQETRKVRTARQEIFRKFWAQLIDRSKPRTELLANRSTTTDHWLNAGIGRSGFSLTVSMTEERTRIECFIRITKDGEERSKAAFKALFAQKVAIEAAFGEPLDWQELPERIGSRICKDIDGGWRMPEEDWWTFQNRILDVLIKLEGAMRDPIQKLVF